MTEYNNPGLINLDKINPDALVKVIQAIPDFIRQQHRKQMRIAYSASLVEDVKKADADPNVTGIVLMLNSPGS